MIRLVARYTIKDGTLDKVEATVKEFVAAVSAFEPDTFYQAYRLGDTKDFIHVMAFPDAAAQHHHSTAPYTTHFVAALHPNCVNPPSFTPIMLVQ